MSKWIDKFNTHPIIGVWKSLIDLVCDDDLVDGATDDSIEDIARLRKVVTYLNGVFENIDPEITPFNHLASLQNSAQNCINEINAFKGNKNVGHLTNANTHVDTLLLQFQQIPASLYAISAENIKESVSAYSKTIGTYISQYKNETEESVSSLSSNIEKLNSDIENKEARLAELSTQIDTVEQTIQQQTSEFNTQYQSSEKDRSDKFDKTVNSYIDKTENNISSYSQKSDEEFKSLSTKASKIIEVLTTLQDDASKVYGVTINTLQGGAYSSYANEERKVANRYRYLASALMLIGVAFLVIPEVLMILSDEPYKFDWVKVLGRIPMSLVVFVPAFYFARESGKHRNNEISNRRRQHILSTLDPYIELMADDKAEELKVHAAKTIFSEANVSSGSDETGNLLSQLSNLAKQLKSN